MEINNIEDIYNSYNIFYDLNIFPFFILILLVFLYKILNYILSYTKNIERKEIQKIQDKDKSIWFLLNKLEQLEKEITILNKSDFYNKLNLLFRDYFVILWFIQAHKMTLKELSQTNIIKKDIFDIYKKGYYYEFNNLKDDFSWRKNIIEKFIYTIKKN